MAGHWDIDDPLHPELWDDDVSTWDATMPAKKGKPMKVKTTSRLTDDDVLELADSIIAGATGKAELTGSPVTLVQLGTLKDEGQTALTDEQDAVADAALKLSLRRAKMGEVREAVDRFALFAVSVYGDDETSLQELGLQFRAPSTATGALTAPENLRSAVGNYDGTVDLRWKTSRRRTIYRGEYAPSPDGPWTLFYAGRTARATCGGLTSGTEYWFRVRVEANGAVSPWSDITRRRAA